MGENGGIESGTGTDGGLPTGINPAWNDALSAIPTEYHSQLIPHLQKWDSGVQEKLQSVQSDFEPYKPFVENRVDPQHIQDSLNLAYALESNPQAIYKALAAEFGSGESKPEGEGTESGQGSPEGEFDLENLPPEFAEMIKQYPQLQEQVSTMQEYLGQQHQERMNAEQDAELDAVFKKMGEENPVFAELNKDGLAEPYITAMFMADYDEKAAMEQFMNFVDAVASYHNKPKPPVMLGSGGFMPEKAIQPRDMSEQQAKETALAMLRHMQGQ